MVMLTVKDIQEILHIGRDTAYRLVRSNGFPSIIIGRSIRIPEDEFNRWIEKYTYKEFII